MTRYTVNAQNFRGIIWRIYNTFLRFPPRPTLSTSPLALQLSPQMLQLLQNQLQLHNLLNTLLQQQQNRSRPNGAGGPPSDPAQITNAIQRIRQEIVKNQISMQQMLQEQKTPGAPGNNAGNSISDFNFSSLQLSKT